MRDWRSLWTSVGVPDEGAPTAEGRLGVIGLMALACVSLATIEVVDPPPRLIWNASESAPVGLYWVRADSHLQAGDLVLVWLSETARVLAAERSYLPLNTPGIKRIAAVAGDVVCVRNDLVLIDETLVARALRIDRNGRELTPWWGCRALEPGEIFLLNDAPASFDGRYFGPSYGRDIIGGLVPLWTF